MITLEEFAKRVEEEFEILETGTLFPDTNFRDLDVWDSMHALIMIALVDTEFDILITGNDLKAANTVRDIYQIIQERIR